MICSEWQKPTSPHHKPVEKIVMAHNKRIQLEINLFGNVTHRAQVLPDLTVLELIQETLVEFGAELRYLDQHHPQKYGLRPSDNEFYLPDSYSMQQIGDKRKLLFQEKPVPIPQSGQALPALFYLRYRSHVFQIAWQPAVIGRPEPGMAQSELLAVNLEPFSLAVSRRHAEIVVENGRLAIRSLSPNPTLLNGVPLPFAGGKTSLTPALPIQSGDEILLQRSGILLLCLQPDSLDIIGNRQDSQDLQD
jgi:hypothetical protein